MRILEDGWDSATDGTIVVFDGYRNVVGKAEIVKEYDRRRKLVVKRIKGIDSLSMVEPNGAFYAFVKYQNIHKSSLKLCRKILEEYKLALVPGSDFGRYGEGYFRISYATSRPLLEKGLDRLEKAFKKMK